MRFFHEGQALRILLLTLLLVGCGVTDSKENPKDTDFVMVSTGEASIIYRAFIGGVEYCKVTKHGIQHIDFDGSIEWDGETCKVRATINDE